MGSENANAHGAGIMSPRRPAGHSVTSLTNPRQV